MDTTRSEQIKTGLQKSFHSGKSAKASTVCYGYRITAEGDLMVYPAEAIYVFHIFERFAAGDSLGKISTSLAQMNVLSPTGKDIWSKETISKILNNEKYLGDVVLGKLSFTIGNKKYKHWLVFYDRKTKKPLAKYSIDNIQSDLKYLAKNKNKKNNKKG